MNQVWEALDGHNGIEGLRQKQDRVLGWIANREGREEERDKSQARRDIVHNFLLAAVGLALTFFGIVEALPKH